MDDRRKDDNLESCLCLVCQEPFLVAMDKDVVCPKCGNKETEAFAFEEEEDSEERQSA